MSLRDAALEWSGRGFRVFPLNPGTKVPPKDFRWKEEATTDRAKIEAWWTDYPNCNIGVATGGGLVVVDVDTKVGGWGALLALDLPADTLTVRTPGGGIHLYYRGDDVANSAGKLGVGIDVRGVGGYVVAPGSFFADPGGAKGYTGHYRIDRDGPTLPAPPHLILMAGAPREREDGGPVSVDDPLDIEYATRYLQNEAPPAIEGQGGNNTAYQVAARLNEIGISVEVAVDLMANHWNPRCLPAWDRDDLVRFAQHAELYAQNRQGSGGAAVLAGEFGAAFALDDGPPPRTSTMLSGAELYDLPPPDWLIEEVLPDVGVGLLAGQSRAGKSLIALRLARSVATGEDFCGREVRKAGGVLLLIAEAHGTLSGRYQAVLGPKFTPGALDRRVVPFFADQIHGPALLDTKLTEAKTRMQEQHGAGLRLVIIDTVAAGLPLSDENDASEVTALMKSLEGFARKFRCVIVCVHHYGKTGATGARGSSAWTASSDFIMAATGDTDEITGEVSARKLALTKSRSSTTGLLSSFNVEGVSLGYRADGREIRSAVANFTEVKTRVGEMPRHYGAFENCVVVVADAAGQLQEAALRQEFLAQMQGVEGRPKTEENQEKAFREAREHALRTGLFEPKDGDPSVFIVRGR